MSEKPDFTMALFDLIEEHHPGALESDPAELGKVAGAICMNLGGLLALASQRRGSRVGYQLFKRVVAMIQEHHATTLQMARLVEAKRPEGVEGLN